jgi:choline dehydrogenase
MDLDGTYDYVIVGAGAAGCVMARRLLDQRDCRVLLLEAGGPDGQQAIHDADLASTTSLWSRSDITWPHVTVAQHGLNGRAIPIPQGRVLGGSTAINTMLYVRGNRRDFDTWRELGNDGWGYTDVLPYFQKSEDFVDGACAYRGIDGPLNVVHYERPSEASEAFAAAVAELGFATAGTFDYNGERQENGAFFYQSTRTKDNQRSSSAVAFLLPMIGHPNLDIRTGAQARRILFEGTRAVGVEYARGATVLRARVTREVIVACGALTTPQLLMLSGIGPADELGVHGIEPVADLPGVGQNLQDQLSVGIGYSSRHQQATASLLAEAGLFMYTQEGPPSASPDLQFLFGPIRYVDGGYRTGGPGFTFMPVLAQPRSRGTVALRSASPTDLPVVDPHYLESDTDVGVLVRSISISRELVNSKAFDALRGRELLPGNDVADRRGLVAYVRNHTSTMWQPVGTCRMGNDDGAVVDAHLRVRGVDGLRVVDASVMPTITCGGTNAATMMIAERAADLIREPSAGRHRCD